MNEANEKLKKPEKKKITRKFRTRVKESCEIKENWTNFLTRGSDGLKISRWNAFDELKEVMSKNTNRPIWREYVSEVMISLMELTTPDELSDLLVLDGSLDMKAYVKIQLSLGVNEQNALNKYEKLLLGTK